jgi:hypothetical protein
MKTIINSIIGLFIGAIAGFLLYLVGWLAMAFAFWKFLPIEMIYIRLFSLVCAIIGVIISSSILKAKSGL